LLRLPTQEEKWNELASGGCEICEGLQPGEITSKAGFASKQLDNTNALRKPDFREFYCRAGFSPAIERFTLAGETPTHHSEVQKQSAFGIKSIDIYSGRLFACVFSVYLHLSKSLWKRCWDRAWV
jgi:hypothetical protein